MLRLSKQVKGKKGENLETSLQKYSYFRKNFAKIPKVIDIPNLIDIQKSSFENFLQARIKPEE